ncbi:Bidirectional sugar transporter SWEET17 [Camellia lanceoleosa]|nr:Bidirectional sugar transporter SWEET17 [Camellia lanceoleosa]
MESPSFYVGVIGNIISVLLFLSPLGTFLRIVKHQSTEEFESFPYICTLLSSSLWTYYGITKPGSYLVATVNGFGVIVEVIYAKTATLAGILNVGFPVAAILVTYLRMQGDLRIDVIGFITPQNVRSSSKGLTLELCRWIGKEPVKSILFEKMQDTMIPAVSSVEEVAGVTKLLQDKKLLRKSAGEEVNNLRNQSRNRKDDNMYHHKDFVAYDNVLDLGGGDVGEDVGLEPLERGVYGGGSEGSEEFVGDSDYEGDVDAGAGE